MATLYYKPFETEPIGELRTEAEEGEDLRPSDSVEPFGENVIADEGADQHDNEQQNTTTNRNTVSRLNYQKEELRNYRNSSPLMSHEMDHLRSQVRHLEAENSALKRELAIYTNPSAWLVDSSQLDTFSKSELIARYVAIKEKYQRQADELQDYKDRVHRLQGDLLIKSDFDKDYLGGTSRSYKQLQKRLEDEALKVKKLQALCRTQEEVIVEMEKRRDSSYYYWKWHGSKDRSVNFNDTIFEENRRLKEEMRRLLDIQSKYSKEDLGKYQYYDWWEQLVDDRRRWHSDRLPLLRDKTYYYYDYDPIRDKKYPDPLKRLVPVSTLPTNSPRTNPDSWLPELTPRRGIYD